MALRPQIERFFTRLFDVRTDDPDVARSARSLLMLLVWCCGCAPFLAFPALFFPNGVPVFTGMLVVTGGYVVAIWFAHKAHVTTATILTMLSYASVIVGVGVLEDYSWAAPVFDVLFVTLAGMVLRTRWIAPVLFVTVLGSYLMPYATHGHTRELSYNELVFYSAVAASVCAVGQAAAMRMASRALREAARERSRAQQLAHDLTDINAELEARVQGRTVELQAALGRAQALGEQLEQISHRDHLTGLYNRRTLDERMSLLLRPDEGDGLLSFVLCDIDDFKAVNDEWGHVIGDEVLRRVAHVLSASTREVDIVVRHGGEEFAIVLPGMGIDAARVVCERTRARVAAIDFDDVAVGLRVTLSMGVTQSWPGCNDDSLLRNADALLYRAKRAGKDRVAA